jgi:succinate dehydrogenase/fumarate reductase iron-sulfur protein
MSCYLRPIKEPEAIFTVQVKRFNPESTLGPGWEVYEVPFVRSMTIIQVLEFLWDQNTYIAFRSNCREMTCGSCAMLINGRPQLACMTLFEDGSRIEPLKNYPVLKDLIVDTSSVERKYRELQLWPERQEGAAVDYVPEAVLAAYQATYSRCIECYACLEACPQSEAETSQFDGPLYMLQIARVGQHPLDSKNRLEQAIERGALSCVNCYECSSVCPIDLDPAAEISKLRRAALLQSISRFWGKLTGRKTSG